MPDIPHMTMVIGGASSGKSAFAEQLVRTSSRPRFYLATAQAHDDEMRAKIEQHRAERAQDNWTTVEAPLHVADALCDIPPGACVLIDCATMWLSNLLMTRQDPDTAISPLIFALRAAPQPSVMVTNEIGLGIVPDNPLARRFRMIQGRFNAQYAAQADLVVNVVAGLPLVLKGQLP